MQVWARLGAFITIDPDEYKKNPEKAIINAIKAGNYEFEGDCYIPTDEGEIEFTI